MEDLQFSLCYNKTRKVRSYPRKGLGERKKNEKAKLCAEKAAGTLAVLPERSYDML